MTTDLPKKLTNKERRDLTARANREMPHGYQMASALKNLNLDSRKFYCCSCSNSFMKQKDNFYTSQSMFYRGNNGYLPICIKCIKFYMVEYERILGSRDAALRRIAMHWDYYIGDKLMESIYNGKSNDAPLKVLAQRNALSQWRGKTYDSYLEETDGQGFITSKEDVEKLESDDIPKISSKALKRWGYGLRAQDYPALEEHYRTLKEQNQNCDSNQELFILELCIIKVQQMEAIREKDTDSYIKLTKLYRETFQQAGLKTIVESDGSSEDALGITLGIISQYTPEEYYRDKELYKDYDGLGSYIERFLLRPMRNLLKGSTDRDPEYSVNGDSE